MTIRKCHLLISLPQVTFLLHMIKIQQQLYQQDFEDLKNAVNRHLLKFLFFLSSSAGGAM